MHEVIRTVDLTKDYGKLRAVNHVNLSVKQGEIHGFLGLNGAGKTTTIRMLLGMIRPTSGSCYLQGKRISTGNTTIWHDVGYMVETAYSYPDLTVRGNLDVVRRLRGIPDQGCIERIMSKLKLDDYGSVKAKHLSLGNAQRLGIAKAMIHQPKILLLDEPTNGLDPGGIIEIRQMLKDLAENSGVTILISSHKLGEVSKLATNLAIIHQGKLIKNLDTRQLENHLKKSLLVDGKNRAVIKSILLESGYEVIAEKSQPLKLLSPHAVSNPDTIATILVNSGHPPTLLQVEKEDLEGYFIRTINDPRGERT